MNAFNKIPKGLTVLATAAALVAGVAYAQTDPAQPAPNATGESGAALGAQPGGAPVTSGGTMSNSGTVDSSANSTPAASSDIVSPEPRADRN